MCSRVGQPLADARARVVAALELLERVLPVRVDGARGDGGRRVSRLDAPRVLLGVHGRLAVQPLAGCAVVHAVKGEGEQRIPGAPTPSTICPRRRRADERDEPLRRGGVRRVGRDAEGRHEDAHLGAVECGARVEECAVGDRRVDAAAPGWAFAGESQMTQW